MTISPNPPRFGMLQLDRRSFQGRLNETQIRQMSRHSYVLAPAFDALEAQGVFVSLNAIPPQGNQGTNAMYFTRISTEKDGSPVQTVGSIHRAQQADWPVTQVNNALVAGINYLGNRVRAAEANLKRLNQMQERMQTLQQLQARLATLSQELTAALSTQNVVSFTPEGGLPMDDGISG